MSPFSSHRHARVRGALFVFWIFRRADAFSSSPRHFRIKTKNIVAVTTSSKKERLEEQLSVFDPAGHFPPLTAEEIVAYETAGPGWDQRQ